MVRAMSSGLKSTEGASCDSRGQSRAPPLVHGRRSMKSQARGALEPYDSRRRTPVGPHGVPCTREQRGPLLRAWKWISRLIVPGATLHLPLAIAGWAFGPQPGPITTRTLPSGAKTKGVRHCPRSIVPGATLGFAPGCCRRGLWPTTGSDHGTNSSQRREKTGRSELAFSEGEFEPPEVSVRQSAEWHQASTNRRRRRLRCPRRAWCRRRWPDSFLG